MWIGEDMFYDTIAAPRLGIRETVKEAIALWVFDQMCQIAFFLVAKRFSIAYEKLKVARVWLIDVWIVNLVHDTVTKREPNAASGMIGCALDFFGTRSPAWVDSQCIDRQSPLSRYMY